MPQRKASKTVLNAVRQHGHDKPVPTCPRCRQLLIEHAHNHIVIPTLEHFANEKGLAFQDVLMALARAALR
jgi:cytidine deaminase